MMTRGHTGRHARTASSRVLWLGRGLGPRLLVAVRNVFLVVLALVFALVVFAAPFVQYGRKHYELIDWNFIIVPCSVLLLGLAALALRALSGRIRAAFEDGRRFARYAVCVSAALFVLQLVVLWGAGFITDWDCGTLALEDPADVASYYSTYPNQLFLGGLFAKLRSLAAALGLPAYGLLAAGGCLCVSVSVCLVSLAAHKSFGAVAGFVASALLFVVCGLSPWILVPYSDTYGMLAPALALWAFVCLHDGRAKAGVLGLSAVLGYCVKPTAVFAVAAVAFVWACQSLRAWMSSRARKEGRAWGLWAYRLEVCGCAAFGALIACALVVGVEAGMPETDDEQSFGAAHYLMMGANDESYGVWSQVDVDFSSSFATSAERSAADVEKWRERVSEMGLVGTAELYGKKLIRTYSDGAFAWEEAGSFYVEVTGSCDVLKAWWGIGDKGNNLPYRASAQVVWFVLILACLACFARRRSAPGEAAACLALLMLSCFLALFECNARYLVLFLPYFCFLAAAGVCRLARVDEGR